MGRTKANNGVYAREASILISFQWRGKRFRETLALPPTPANIKYAVRLRGEIQNKIEAGIFNFADYFPDSKTLGKLGLAGAESILFAAMAEDWLKLIKSEVAETTWREYHNSLHRHFIPALGATNLRDFTEELVEKHLAQLIFKSNKTYNNVVSPFRMVLEKAFRWKKMPANLTHIIGSRAKQKPRPDPLAPDEIEMILAKMRERYNEQVFNYFDFAFFTGMRPSELIALEWADIDFNRRLATVSKALVRAITKATKTEEIRDVELNPRALAAIQRQKKLTFLQGGPIFHNPLTSRPYTDTQVQMEKFWTPTLKVCGIRHRDARQTRHTFATYCLTADLNPSYVAEQLGHSREMFFRVYSKWINGRSNQLQQDKLEAFMNTNVTTVSQINDKDK